MTTSTARTRSHLLRGGIEFVVIVVGVLTALAADEWRQANADRAAETEIVARLIFDLNEDSATLRAAERGFTGPKRLALERLVALDSDQVVDQDVADDVARATPWAWHLASAHSTTYDELRGSGQFGLIRDRTLRATIARYYTDYADMLGSIDARRTQLGPLSYRIVRRPDAEGFEGRSPARDTRAAAQSSSQLAALQRQLDHVREAAIAELNFADYAGASTGDFAGRTEALIAALRIYAADIGEG